MNRRGCVDLAILVCYPAIPEPCLCSLRRSHRGTQLHSIDAFSRKLKEVYRTISGLKSRLIGTNKDRERGEEGDRGAQRVSSNGLARDAASEEGELERWRKLVSEHQL